MKNLTNENNFNLKDPKKFDTSKKTVLVWLDFGAYPYFFLGIISELSKLDNYEFVGIITRKQDLSFFENQKIIHFKKLIYYPDCYIDKSVYNQTKLENYEKQYDLNLWLDIFGDRSFYKYWVDFHKFSKNEIFSIVENSITFFVDIFEENKPEFILLQQPGENISNLLLYKIAKKIGIKTLTPNPIYMHDKILISDNIDCREISDEFEQMKQDSSVIDKNYDEEFLKDISLAKSMDVLASFNYNAISVLQKFRYYLKRIRKDSEPIYLNKGKTRLKMLKNRFDSYFKVRKRQHFLDKNAKKSIDTKKFIYFPLQS